MAQIRSLCVVTPREGNPGGFTATEPAMRALTQTLLAQLGVERSLLTVILTYRILQLKNSLASQLETETGRRAGGSLAFPH